MTINLNQPITIDQFKQLLRLLKSSRSLLIIFASILLIIFFGMSSSAIYETYKVYEQKNADFLDLSNKMMLTERKLSKLLSTEANYFSQLKAAPDSKSQLIDLLSNIATANNLIVKKLNTYEGSQNKEKDGVVEMELDGRFSSINEFLLKIKPHLSASNVMFVKLEKKKESQYVHLSMVIKFSKSPELKKNNVSYTFNSLDYFYDAFNDKNLIHLGYVQVLLDNDQVQEKVIEDKAHVVSQKNKAVDLQKLVDFNQSQQKKIDPLFAFNLNGIDFFYESFDNWSLRKVGFVQVPNSANIQQEKPSQDKVEGVVRQQETSDAVKRVDPFLPSPKLTQLDSVAGNRKSTGDEGAFFLSGIFLAKHKGVCIVTLPSGESKVFEVGENIDGKRRVIAIRSDGVTIRSSLDREYKVGQEIYVK